MNQQHASIDTLSAYLADPAATEFEELRTHLIGCRECREQASLITRLRAEDSPIASNRLLEEKDELRIVNYVEGQTSAKQSEAIAQQLETDKQALKTALHYATQSTAMRRELGTEIKSEKVAPKPVQSPSTGLSNVLAKFFDWRPPVWISTPVAAALTLLVVVIINPYPQEVALSGLSVASYQDHAVVTFKKQGDVQPGIGFFSGAKGIERPFDRMDVSLNKEQQLILRWASIENTDNYRLKLFLIDENQRTLVNELTSNTPSALIEGFSAKPGSRYEWELSGQTSDGFLFNTDGGFVFND